MNFSVNKSVLSVACQHDAAERQRLQHGDRSYQSISSAHMALRNKPQAAVAAVKRWDRRTRGRTDGRPTVT